MRSFPDWPSIRPTRSKSQSLTGFTSEPSLETSKTTHSNGSTAANTPSAGVTMVRVPLPSKKTIIGGDIQKKPPPSPQQRDMRRRRSQFFRGNKASPPSIPQDPGRCIVDTDAVTSLPPSGQLRRKGSLARMAPFWRMGRKTVIPENDKKDETHSVDSDELKTPPPGKGDGTAGPHAIEIKVLSYEEEEDTREGCEDSVLVTSHTSSASSNQGLDVSDLRFSSDLGEVEVYIGDLDEDEEVPIEESAASTPIDETQELPPPVPRPELFRAHIPEPSRRSSSLLQPSVRHESPMVEQSLTKQAAAEQMMAASSSRHHPLSAPVAMIERDMSDLVSELTLPRLPRSKSKQLRRKSKKMDVEEDDEEGEEHLQRESVAQVQQAISQLQKEGESLPSHKIISTLLQVTESLACKRDRELIRQQLSQLSSFSDNEEEEEELSVQRDVVVQETLPPPEEAEELCTLGQEEESYVPGNMCQFPVGNHGVVGIDDDDGSETSSFMDWLETQERPKSQWNVFSEMVDLSNYWNTTTAIQQRSSITGDILLEEDEETVEDHISVKNDDVRTPPKIYRTLSSGKAFRPRSFAELQHEQQQKTAEEIRQEEDAIVTAGKRLLERHARTRTSSSSPVANKPSTEDQEDDAETTAREMLFVRKYTGSDATTLRSVPSDEMSHERYRAYIKERSKDYQTRGSSREPISSNLRRISVVPVQNDESRRRSAAPPIMVASPSYAEEMRRSLRLQAAKHRASIDP